VRPREAPEEVAGVAADLGRAHVERVVEPRGGRPWPRGGVTRGGDRGVVQTAVSEPHDGGHGGAVAAVVVVREGPGHGDPCFC
jgi:hypothetical protein